MLAFYQAKAPFLPPTKKKKIMKNSRKCCHYLLLNFTVLCSLRSIYLLNNTIYAYRKEDEKYTVKNTEISEYSIDNVNFSLNGTLKFLIHGIGGKQEDEFHKSIIESKSMCIVSSIYRVILF